MGSNPVGVIGCLYLVSVVCCHVEVSASGLSLVQGSLIECGLEASMTRRPWPAKGYCAMGGGGDYKRRQ